MFKCKISGVREKMEFERKSSGEKKIKVFLGESLECGILLSSYSLVGLLMLILQVKVMEKKEIFKVFFG